MKIAIIGAGNMGGSIARGLAKGSLIADSDIIVSNPSAGKLEKLKEEFPKNIHDIRYAYAYCIHGCMGIVKTWLSDPQPGSPEHVADLTAQFITDTAHAYLHKMEQL